MELYTNLVYRIAYQGGANQPPVARALVTPAFGATPLGVQFSGTTSSDPEGQALAYSWSFGDGSAPSTLAEPIHFYFGPVGRADHLHRDPDGARSRRTRRRPRR